MCPLSSRGLVAVIMSDLPTPKYFCQYSKQIFYLIFSPFFLWNTINQSKQKSVKGQFFYHSSCKNSYFLMIQTHYKSSTLLTLGRFILFTSAQVILEQRPYFEKYPRTPILPADFCTNMIKYGWVGRSVMYAYHLAQ